MCSNDPSCLLCDALGPDSSGVAPQPRLLAASPVEADWLMRPVMALTMRQSDRLPDQDALANLLTSFTNADGLH